MVYRRPEVRSLVTAPILNTSMRYRKLLEWCKDNPNNAQLLDNNTIKRWTLTPPKSDTELYVHCMNTRDAIQPMHTHRGDLFTFIIEGSYRNWCLRRWSLLTAGNVY